MRFIFLFNHNLVSLLDILGLWDSRKIPEYGDMEYYTQTKQIVRLFTKLCDERGGFRV
jgi:hypothetical protein